ncbi:MULTISPECIES: hypothetical protein [unclassified Chelatococcus]|uniref:hypothetical protein n=1 Tax=unclassified Chelatococcus TaxID=2638111 RepID=UPI001BD02A17|nr:MULTISPECIES: hypothetical protein [unclassified Chelatococcus]CAH1670474.1 conserved hypothetical protein [Hyphomicrobiales bacterium]MBS7738341.1 hypothetical protein [Chelatococcus sp. HY11]MBX3545869.1 hypothetical protein [Chelatococcus sp.]MCO5077313.1 hypothetical protein [Chelatococcus sp.]CAH1677296.1 conserved hypothetical protein [Hyphomicrobiales bacterium]
MGEDSIRYLIFMRNRWRYKPTAAMKAHGFNFLTFGPGIIIDGKPYPSAEDKAKAIRLNEDWDRIRRQVEAPAAPKYPLGSVGDGYERAMRLRAAERTNKGKAWTTEHKSRDDWPRAWRWLEVFATLDPRTIQPEHFMSADPKTGQLRGLIPKIESRVSATERHRTVKVWRALWKRMAAMGYCEKDMDPSHAFANSAADPRQDLWTEGEVARLCKAAWRQDFKGMAALMATAWDSQLSPVDARKLTAGQRFSDDHGDVFFVSRAKTGRAAAGTLGRRATAILNAYVAGLGFELHETSPIFRTRGFDPGAKGGKPHPPSPYTKDRLGRDFRIIRTLVFGEGDKRQLADMRRSGTVEAFSGGASDHAVSTKMANTLAASSRLQKTYNPVNLATVRDVDAARREGRAKLRENKTRQKV